MLTNLSKNLGKRQCYVFIYICSPVFIPNSGDAQVRYTSNTNWCLLIGNVCPCTRICAHNHPHQHCVFYVWHQNSNYSSSVAFPCLPVVHHSIWISPTFEKRLTLCDATQSPQSQWLICCIILTLMVPNTSKILKTNIQLILYKAINRYSETSFYLCYLLLSS